MCLNVWIYTLRWLLVDNEGEWEYYELYLLRLYMKILSKIFSVLGTTLKRLKMFLDQFGISDDTGIR